MVSDRPPEPEPRRWRPLSWRQHLIAGLLGLALAAGLTWEVVQPKLKLMAARAARGEPPVPIGLPTEAVRAGQASVECRHSGGRWEPSPAPTTGGPPGHCVGGRMPIQMVPAASPVTPAAAAASASGR